jgi:hypothetical protein
MEHKKQTMNRHEIRWQKHEVSVDIVVW